MKCSKCNSPIGYTGRCLKCPDPEKQVVTQRTFNPKEWFQVSRNYRLVARFPEGKTGKQALAECGGSRCDEQSWIDSLGERSAGDHYLRCYAIHQELTVEEWLAFRKAGGKTYEGRNSNG